MLLFRTRCKKKFSIIFYFNFFQKMSREIFLQMERNNRKKVTGAAMINVKLVIASFLE